MLRPNTIIQIEQQSNTADTKRNKKFLLDFVITGEIVSSWQNLTDTCKLKVPRTIYVQDDTGPLVINNVRYSNWAGQSIYGVVGAESPLFMRGDKITISLGYFHDPMDGNPEVLEMDERFTGYITKIKNKMPIEIECEDQMWKLKQIKAENKVWKASEYTVQKMLTEMLKGTGISVVDGVDGTVQTNIGDFRTQNETIAMVLDRLRRDGGLYSYFRGPGLLRCSGIVYYPQDRVDHVFRFQENIHTGDQLEYNRKEDLNIAIKAHAEFITEGTGTNNDGTTKTKRKRLEVMVTKSGVLSKEEEKDFQGDLITIPVIGARTIADLTKRAKEYLPKFYYTGFKGSFTTFGQPAVKHGDGAIIQDPIIPERDGTYLVKQVTISWGVNLGIKQKVLLHLRIDKGYTQEQLNAGI